MFSSSPFVIKYGPEGELWELAIGEHDGRTFLLDPDMVLATCPDMLIAMSERLGFVVGGVAETVSGTYELTVARSGALLRHVFICYSGMTTPFELGTPLAVEQESPIDHPWGTGIWAAFAALDLDVAPWMQHGPAVGVRYTAERQPEGGPVNAASNEHYKRYAHSDDHEPQLTIVAGGPEDA
jgi:hypothetical protein